MLLPVDCSEVRVERMWYVLYSEYSTRYRPPNTLEETTVVKAVLQYPSSMPILESRFIVMLLFILQYLLHYYSVL